MNTGVEGSLASGSVLYGFTLTTAIARQGTDNGTTRLPAAPQMFGNARLAWVLPGQLPTFALAAHVLGPRPADLSDAQFPRDPFAPGQVGCGSPCRATRRSSKGSAIG